MNTFALIRCLGIVSLMSGILIVGANYLTRDRIQRNQEQITRESIAQLLPGAGKQVAYAIGADGGLTVLASSDVKGPKLFAGYDNSGKLLGVVLEASERGYADVITGMYAYEPVSKTITGFSVVEMKETPGLGDKIIKDPAFLENFRRLETSKPIVTVKNGTKKNPWEIDAISGATISSRAVGRMLQKSIQQMGPIVARNLQRLQEGN
jgi:Na+-translocating ferredoxin:NAD+ oxidoreductase subunit G